MITERHPVKNVGVSELIQLLAGRKIYVRDEKTPGVMNLIPIKTVEEGLDFLQRNFFDHGLVTMFLAADVLCIPVHLTMATHIFVEDELA